MIVPLPIATLPPSIAVSADAPTVIRTIRVEPGESFVLRLPVPDREHFWTLEVDQPGAFTRSHLPTYRSVPSGMQQVWRFAASDQTSGPAKGPTRVATIRGWCARGNARPVKECRIEVVITGESDR